MKNLHPSPSEMVMTAMLHLQNDWGASSEDIIKYVKRKYGLDEDNVKSRITNALRRGLKYKILYRKNGLYRLNGSVLKIPSKNEENPPEDTRKEVTKEKQDIGKEVMSSKNTHKRKKRSKVLFLCPECQLKENDENSKKIEGEWRQRDSNNGGANAGSPGESSRKSRWKDFLKMGISFRSRRLNV